MNSPNKYFCLHIFQNYYRLEKEGIGAEGQNHGICTEELQC
jgi:hypothetical protein